MKILYKEIFNLSYNFLVSIGVKKKDSKIITSQLIASDINGFSSHGLLRLKQYYEGIRSGIINTKGKIKIKKINNITILESNRVFGQVAMNRAVNLINRENKNISIVAVNNCSHIGRLSDYLEKLSQNDFISLIFCNGGIPSCTLYPLAERICGTNPFGFSLPLEKNKHLIIDFATSMLSEGRVRLEKLKNKKLTKKAIIDRNGNISNDPKKFYSGGALMPFGEEKGSAIMLICELLGGFLITNNNSINKKYLDGNNCLIITIKKKLFDFNKTNFNKQYKSLKTKIKKSKKLQNTILTSKFLLDKWQKKSNSINKKFIKIDKNVIFEIKKIIQKKYLKYN